MLRRMRSRMLFAALLAFAACQSTPAGGARPAAGTTAPIMTADTPPPSPAPPVAAAASSTAAWWVPGQEFEALESVAATRTAQSAGLKQSLGVPYPVKCPSIDTTGVDTKALRATGKHAALLADPTAFFDGRIGVLEAIALLGPAVLCNHQAKSPFMNLHLAPIAGAHGVTIETQNGKLIGIVIEFEPTVSVDFAALTAAHGAPRQMPRAPHGPYPGSDAFSMHSASHEGTFSIGRVDHGDPASASRVHRMIVRRFERTAP